MLITAAECFGEPNRHFQRNTRASRNDVAQGLPTYPDKPRSFDDAKPMRG
jgi:hypothetical protein